MSTRDPRLTFRKVIMPPNENPSDSLESIAQVFIVDPDPTVHEHVRTLLACLNVRVKTFASAEAFLSADESLQCACLITEANLPGINGVELIEQMKVRVNAIPTILLANHSDVALAVKAMRAGAADFMEKPFVDRLLLKRVSEVLNLDT